MPHISNRPVDWEALVTDNENRLYRAALAILGDSQEAEDAVQDAFLVFLEKAPADLDRPDAWLMRVLVNGCKSRLRLAWRRVGPLPDTLPAPALEERAELEELFSLPPGGPNGHPSFLLCGILHSGDCPYDRTAAGHSPLPSDQSQTKAEEAAGVRRGLQGRTTKRRI